MSEPSCALAEAVAEWQSARRDLEIAKAIRRLLVEGGAKAAGWCHPKDKLTIQQDAELTVFLRSVARAGAWAEERDRIRFKRKIEKRPEDHSGLPGAHPMPLPAIIRCLPIWRMWGRLLIEAERSKPVSPAGPASPASARSSGDSGKGGGVKHANDTPQEDAQIGTGMKGP